MSESSDIPPGTPGTVTWDEATLQLQLSRAVEDLMIARAHERRCTNEVARWRRLVEKARGGAKVVTRIP